MTEPQGFTTVYEYDSDGNIIAQTDPLGNTTRFTFDANGNQLTKTDPLGNTWTSTYDANNNKLSDTDPLGNTKTLDIQRQKSKRSPPQMQTGEWIQTLTMQKETWSRELSPQDRSLRLRTTLRAT